MIYNSLVFSYIMEKIITNNGSSVILYENFLTQQFSRELFDELKDSKYFKQVNKRSCFLLSPKPYQYGSIKHCPNNDWPSSLKKLIKQLNMFLKAELNSVLVNKYTNGDSSLGWHADDEDEIVSGAPIASISLNAARTFEMSSKRISRIKSINLTDKSLLVMAGRTQQDWLHRVPPAQCSNVRLNLTFRQLR